MAAPTPKPTLPSPPPEAWEPLRRLARLAARPVERFLRIEAASGLALLFSAAISLALANSPWAPQWAALWETPLGLRLGPLAFERSIAWWVNDGLMVIFFFVVGLEIRREAHEGELSELKRAALPFAAALGGMVAPAAIYLAIAGAPETRHGWGVPMATDIAFAVGVLALLGPRVPPALRVLLLALAVIDDLGAIIVIALFYSSGLSPFGFAVAGVGLVGVFVLQALGVRSKLAYVLPALVVWGGTYAGGVHPTIAGVVLGLVTPVRAWLGADGFVQGVKAELARTDGAGLAPTLHYVRLAEREAVSPSEGLIHALHPWVAFGIMPIFALANAGVSLEGLSVTGDTARIIGGAFAGLLLGKPLGIVLASLLVVKLGVARLPTGIGGRQLLVLGLVAGIGFTMALFIAQLAFPDPTQLGAAKLGVLAASGAAGVIGLVLGRLLLPIFSAPGAATSEAEAERSTAA